MQKCAESALRPHFGFKKIRHFIVGIPRMQNERQICSSCSLGMCSKALELIVFRAVSVVKIQPGLANTDHFGMRGNLNKLVGSNIGTILGVMRMRTDRAPDIVMGFGNRRNRFKIRQPATNRDHASHAGRSGASQNVWQILGICLAVQIGVAVDQHVQRRLARAALSIWAKAANAACLASR